MTPPSWPFIVWGLDILGPFPRAIGGYRYLHVAIDKFTKWPEATLVVKINKQSAVKFIKSIVCRFRVLNRIITDNGSQFTSGAFQGYCEDLCIQICYASIAHPESNGQVERDNAEILKGLKTCTYDDLKKYDKKWIDELPCALWGNQTSPNRATGETPFLVYGVEVVLPLEVTMGSFHVQTYNEAAQDQLRRDDIDLINERRWQSAIKNTRYCQTLQCYHQWFMHSREHQVNDLVLRQVPTNSPPAGRASSG
jgi:transposase InsO family protein